MLWRCVSSKLKIRTYGTAGSAVMVLHGGPGAAGSAGPVARGLEYAFRVFEPWQRGSGGISLSVARHVQDLHDVRHSCCPAERPALVGESWGAMLALAYAAEYPDEAGPIALIGCGTFDAASRSQMQMNLEERIDDQLRQHLDALDSEFPDPEDRLREKYRLTERLYHYAPVDDGHDSEEKRPFDLSAHRETWADMVRLQEEGVYPAAFSRIRSPVLMLHGSYDPHPGRMIQESLLPHLPRLKYIELERCGHSPWREKWAKERMFQILIDWLGSANVEAYR